MSKILKNTTGVPLFIADTGTLLPILPATFTIPPQDYWIWAASSDIVGPVGVGDVIVNDGSFDLNASDGMDLLKGIFPNPVRLEGATDGTDIGNVGDRLKVEADIASGAKVGIDPACNDVTVDNEADNPVPVELSEDQQTATRISDASLLCVMEKILTELRKQSFHLSQITDIENDGFVNINEGDEL